MLSQVPLLTEFLLGNRFFILLATRQMRLHFTTRWKCKFRAPHNSSTSAYRCEVLHGGHMNKGDDSLFVVLKGLYKKRETETRGKSDHAFISHAPPIELKKESTSFGVRPSSVFPLVFYTFECFSNRENGSKETFPGWCRVGVSLIELLED